MSANAVRFEDQVPWGTTRPWHMHGAPSIYDTQREAAADFSD